MSYYHYTKGCLLPSIVRDGIIKTSIRLVEKHEIPAVWLTKSSKWEVACNLFKNISAEEFENGKIYPVDAVETIKLHTDYMKKEVGMCRILISETVSVVSWTKHKYVSGISTSRWNVIDTYSRRIGSLVDLWVCCYDPIPKKYWEGIEVFVDNDWVRWDEKMLIDDWVELCLSCNGKQPIKAEITKRPNYDELRRQEDFINRHIHEITEMWEANKHKNGYLRIFVKPDYTPSDAGFQFVEETFERSSFQPLGISRSNSYALVHFLWLATSTMFKLALPYEITYPEIEN